MPSKNKVRLPKEIYPIKYSLTIKPNLTEFSFEGEEFIVFQNDKTTKELQLHSKDLEILEAHFGKEKLAIEYNKEDERIILTFKQKLSAGKHKIHLKFKGHLNDQMRGFYRSRYEVNGQERHLATTQFEATDARRAFPCFDEPAMKAVFDVKIIAPKGHTVISNTLAKSTKTHSDDLHIVEFASTPKMSTYLLAFIVGEFEYIEGKTEDGVLVRVFATPGKIKQAEFALKVAKKALTFLTQYFNVPYPLSVLDLIAIPDFSAGAMENWGATTYRETALLIDPEHSPASSKQRVATVIAHELAHQWFGNLVTMEWWTDLWLNEGFASYMEYVVVDHIFPEWKMWDYFAIDAHAEALELDAYVDTHPIEVTVHHPNEIAEIFDPVSYSKGSVVIKMIADYLGEKTFRNGLRYYMRKHKFGNTVTNDLWLALEHVSKKPVSSIMQKWTKQPGYPIVKATLKGETVNLTQQRFFSNPVSGEALKSRGLWPIPIRYSTESTSIPRDLLLAKPKINLSPELSQGEWIKLNKDDSGLFRVVYSHELIARLERALQEKKLSTIDRLGIVRDAFALAEANHLATTEALRLSKYYKDEGNFAVWAELVTGLNRVGSIIEHEKFYPEFKEFVLSVITQKASELGWHKRSNDSHFDILLRSTLLAAAGVYGDKQIVKEARKLFADRVKGESIDPNLRGAVYRVVAEHGTEKEYKQMKKMYLNEKMNEEKNRLARAMALFPSTKLVGNALDLALSEQVRSQDLIIFLIPAMGNKVAGQFTWKYIKANWNILLKKLPVGTHLLRHVVGATGGFVGKAILKDVQTFYRKNPTPEATRASKQAIEQIMSNNLWLERDGKAIKSFLGNE